MLKKHLSYDPSRRAWLVYVTWRRRGKHVEYGALYKKLYVARLKMAAYKASL